QLGGFVDPNCLMIDKLKCDPLIRCWASPLPGDPLKPTADRHIFEMLRRRSAVGFTSAPTTHYAISATAADSARRRSWIRELHRNDGAAALTTDAALPPWGEPILAPAQSAE